MSIIDGLKKFLQKASPHEKAGFIAEIRKEKELYDFLKNRGFTSDITRVSTIAKKTTDVDESSGVNINTAASTKCVIVAHNLLNNKVAGIQEYFVCFCFHSTQLAGRSLFLAARILNWTRSKVCLNFLLCFSFHSGSSELSRVF
jgi:hypothetical protein